MGEGGTRHKYVVVLQGGLPVFDNHDDVAVVVCSSQNHVNPDTLRPFEVLVPASDDGFERDTLIDCRWVFTVRKRDAPTHSFRFRLPPSALEEISLALVEGLQI
jgi:mRNA-degrading endonuclease toxin of MazEF toxin-antitoxin module